MLIKPVSTSKLVGSGLLAAHLFSAGHAQTPATLPRPSEWAVPVPEWNVPNLNRVTPTIYRSAQPNEREFEHLAALGVQSVLNLREFHNDKDETEHTNLKLYQVAINTFSFGEPELLEALQLLAKAEKPVLVHCWHGADRTGAVLAAYRMVCQNWTNEQALDELKNGGYNFHSIFDNIPKLIKGLDANKLRQQLGAQACPD